jgi:cbb3-type cytochrome oxidase maturation protein
MAVMFILLPVALLFSGAALIVFFWAVRAGQFDDLETPGLRILNEEDELRRADGADEVTGRRP